MILTGHLLTFSLLFSQFKMVFLRAKTKAYIYFIYEASNTENVQQTLAKMQQTLSYLVNFLLIHGIIQCGNINPRILFQRFPYGRSTSTETIPALYSLALNHRYLGKNLTFRININLYFFLCMAKMKSPLTKENIFLHVGHRISEKFTGNETSKKGITNSFPGSHSLHSSISLICIHMHFRNKPSQREFFLCISN